MTIKRVVARLLETSVARKGTPEAVTEFLVSLGFPEKVASKWSKANAKLSGRYNRQGKLYWFDQDVDVESVRSVINLITKKLGQPLHEKDPEAGHIYTWTIEDKGVVSVEKLFNGEAHLGIFR